MTISTTTIKNSFTGNASTTAFTYTFPINTTSEISVIERSALGAETVKVEGTGSTNYGIADNGSAGGVVTMVTAPAAGTTLILRRNTDLTQETDYVANDPFPAETHEDALDKLQMQTQELQEQADRSFKISRTNTITSSEFTDSAADRANKVLAFNAAGEISVTQELGTFKGASATTTTAAFVVRDIVKGSTSAQANNIYICIKASPIGTALTNTTFWVLIVDAVSAATSASTATTKAAEAVTAKNASVVAKDASVAAKDAAIVAKDAAATSATAAASSADAFDDIYLGTKSSDPSQDNDGDALAAGMLYFNSSSNLIRVYNGSAFQDAAVDTTTFLTLTATQTLTNKTLTAPKIGTSILDTGGNELAKLTATGSAVNEFTIANAASGNAPRLSSTGETNVGLDLLAKGTGHVTIRGNSNSGAVQFNCESNTHGQIVKAQPHSAAVTNISLLPAGASSTLVSLVSADTLTNKTLTAPKINEDVAVSSTATELNLLDGATVTTAEINKLASAGTLKQAGKETIWIPSNAMTPTTTNGAERATVETTATRPDMQVLDFDKDADQFAQFSIAFPNSWNLGTVTFQAFWSGIAATTDVDWGVQAVAMNDNQTIDVAFGTAVVVTDNAQGAVEELLVSAESGAITIAGTPADNDLTYFQIYRDVSGDGMAGDARLHGVKIFYTTNAANDA